MTLPLPPFSAKQLLQSISSLPPAGSWLVGLSGGADSTALLYALVQNRAQLDTPFRAVHINHGLHPDADQWQQHCESLCRDWSVPFACIKVQIKDTGKGLEAEARSQRYAAIASLLQPNEALLTGHHADDQAETLLLNLMRGSGVDGLSCMPQQKTFGQHQLFRPLLNFHRQALLDYLELQGVSWLEDPSNLTLDQDRNYIRNSVFPLLESRFKGTVKRLLLTQKTMAETRTLLEPMAQQRLQEGLLHSHVFRTSDQLLQKPALFKLVVRRWLKNTGAPGLPGRQLDDLYAQLGQVTSDNKITIRWLDHCLRFYQGCLWLHHGSEIDACETANWSTTTNLSTKTSILKLNHSLGSLSLVSDQPFALPATITVASRQCQSALSLMRGTHHQSLKNLFQSAMVPAWLRNCVPLLLIDNKLAAVGDWATSQSFGLWLAENHVKFTWQPNAPVLQFLAQQQHNRPRQT